MELMENTAMHSKILKIHKPNKTLKVQLVGGYYILPSIDLSNKVISIEEWCKSRPLSIQEYCELNNN